MAEISIIVPVYKVEAYLSRCVDSILAQVYSDFDLILVDDGSPDGSGSLCDAYAARDARVHVIHQENGGLSAARNAGIDWAFLHSDSEWLTFIDSDDWVHPEYLELLLKTALDHGADVCIGEYANTNGEPLPETLYPRVGMAETEDYYVRHVIAATVAWGKLYKKECFRDLRYPPGKLHEDEFVTYRILFRYPEIPVVGAPLYAYFQNPEGITGGAWSPERLAALEALEGQVAFFLEIGAQRAARARFRSLARRHLREQAEANRYDGFSDREKRACVGRLRANLRRLLKKYRGYRWVSLWNRGEDLFVYTSAYPGLRLLHRVWRAVKRVAKGLPGVSRLGRRFSAWRRNRAVIRRFARACESCRAVLLQTPLHGNLGDHAIAVSEAETLRALGISCLDFPYTQGIERQCAARTPRQTAVLVHGGGFLGSLWPREEARLRATLAAFHDHRVIVLPQTVYFDMDTEAGRACFEESRRSYAAHPDLTVFLRERRSYDFMAAHMPEVHIELVPDMVMRLDPGPAPRRRQGVLICLRDDRERTLEDRDRERLVRLVREYDGALRFTDTVAPRGVEIDRREREVRAKLAEFASARLVVTDRLHGMIFAAITETPCVVLNSLSHKLAGCQAWFRDLDYIRIIDDVGDIPRALKALEAATPKYDRQAIETAMEPLYDALKAIR